MADPQILPIPRWTGNRSTFLEDVLTSQTNDDVKQVLIYLWPDLGEDGTVNVESVALAVLRHEERSKR